jgi:MFS family permease
MDGPLVAPSLARANAGLDWLNFFTANLQTAFGPFVAVYLTQQAWTQADIGLALGVGSIAAMAAQVPAGALVDAIARKARAAGAAILAIIAGALTLALAPTMLPVLAAEISHAFASCMLTPAIAAISLGVAGERPGAAGVRLGRNARFASIGNGTAAGLMAIVGWRLGPRAVFLLGAALAVPGLLALRGVAERPAAGGGIHADAQRPNLWPSLALLRDVRLRWFAACCALFHLSNAFMLPLAAGAATASLGNSATLVIGACIVGPQIVVAALSPSVGRGAERWGRRPVLVAGMLALPLRGLALAAVVGSDVLPAWLLIPVQLLDGVSGAVFGVLMPLVASDITRRTGRFNLCMGVLGLAVGAAAALSSLAGGWLAARSMRWALVALAGAGGAGAIVAWLMPETRPADGQAAA